MQSSLQLLLLIYSFHRSKGACRDESWGAHPGSSNWTYSFHLVRLSKTNPPAYRGRGEAFLLKGTNSPSHKSVFFSSSSFADHLSPISKLQVLQYSNLQLAPLALSGVRKARREESRLRGEDLRPDSCTRGMGSRLLEAAGGLSLPGWWWLFL